jgi:hypothetical protein
MDPNTGGVPRFVLGVVASDGNDVFGARTAADLAAYGRGLVDDVKSYLGGDYCEVAVESTYPTGDTSACASAPNWCTIGDQDPASGRTNITWAYLRGSFTGGPYSIQTWNAGP